MAFGVFVTRDMMRTQFKTTMNSQGDVAAIAATERMDIECNMIKTRGLFCPDGQKFMEFYRSPRRGDGGYEIVDVDENEEDTGEPINYTIRQEHGAVHGE